jgi:hypothetical protein
MILVRTDYPYIRVGRHKRPGMNLKNFRHNSMKTDVDNCVKQCATCQQVKHEKVHLQTCFSNCLYLMGLGRI